MTDRYGLTNFTSELSEDRVLWVEFNRPERRNAISPEMHEELPKLFEHMARDRDARVAVLTGAGDRAFTVGADFGGMQDNLDAGGYDDAYNGLMLDSPAIVRAQLAIAIPVIAAINGDAIGLGATMALFCDIVLLAEDAKIGDPHVRAGLVAGDGGAILWPLVLGPHKAKELLITGDLMTGRDAHAMGIGNHVYPRDQVKAEARALAQRIAAGPRIPIQFNKRLVNLDIAARVNQVLDASLAMEAISLASRDHHEAVASFIEKRPATFE
ncbi:MAG: enoyl-CoA hydratase/isomerase family protein [Acidimicrobiales bacterium]|nr:enoyl-CoA hydratase/isomerase family protein [Acidimicrobiales bacterium]